MGVGYQAVDIPVQTKWTGYRSIDCVLAASRQEALKMFFSTSLVRVNIRENVDVICLQKQLSEKSVALRVTQEKMADLQQVPNDRPRLLVQ